MIQFDTPARSLASCRFPSLPHRSLCRYVETAIPATRGTQFLPKCKIFDTLPWTSTGRDCFRQRNWFTCPQKRKPQILPTIEPNLELFRLIENNCVVFLSRDHITLSYWLKHPTLFKITFLCDVFVRHGFERRKNIGFLQVFKPHSAHKSIIKLVTNRRITDWDCHVAKWILFKFNCLKLLRL